MPNEKWTIAQTIQEAVSAELYQEAQAARISRGRRGRFVISLGLHGSPDPRYEEFRIKDAAWKHLKSMAEAGLRNMLLASELSSTGRFGSVAADERSIPPSGWQHIKIIDWQKSTGRELPTRTEIFDIRISKAEVKVSPRKALQKVEQKRISRVELIRELTSLMKNYPDEPCLTKAMLVEAGRSHREIAHCWDEAFKRAGTPAAWETSGRRKEAWLDKLPESSKRKLGILDRAKPARST
ncbi:hypothetical protein [Bradyrhizobium genomosp. III]|uniref:hypothetical protein n=1 Tax=Bradyrhizobium genomosp. III TaxID=2683271 RepID=UPI00057726E2|nr:hypothetical protein [Bradyrhizobium sp. CCBAU 15635]